MNLSILPLTLMARNNGDLFAYTGWHIEVAFPIAVCLSLGQSDFNVLACYSSIFDTSAFKLSRHL